MFAFFPFDWLFARFFRWLCVWLVIRMLALLFDSPVVFSNFIFCVSMKPYSWQIGLRRQSLRIRFFQCIWFPHQLYTNHMFASSQNAKAISEAVNNAEGHFRSRRDIANYLVRRFSKLPRGNFLTLNVIFLSSWNRLSTATLGVECGLLTRRQRKIRTIRSAALPLHLLDVPMMSVLVVLQNPYMPPPFGWSSKDKCIARMAKGPEVWRFTFFLSECPVCAQIFLISHHRVFWPNCKALQMLC